MSDRPTQKTKQYPTAEPRDPQTHGEDRSSPVQGKAKRGLYLVPDAELPTSSGDPAHLSRGKAAPDEVQSATPVASASIDGGGATSGTSAGFGTTGRGKPTDASNAGMTGFGVSSGIPNRGSPGSIATHGPGQSGAQVKRDRAKRRQK